MLIKEILNLILWEILEETPVNRLGPPLKELEQRTYLKMTLLVRTTDIHNKSMTTKLIP